MKAEKRPKTSARKSVRKTDKTLGSVLARRKTLLSFSVVAGIAVSMVAFHFSPKTYKVQTTISIQTQYFQVPMVSDFVPQTYDETELRSQRESLVRQSMDYDYLRELGAKFGLFNDEKPADVTSYDLYKLAGRFEIINLNAMTFLVSFRSHDPVLGYKVLQDYIDHLRTTIETDRRTMLSQLRNAIKDQLELLAFGGKSPAGIMLSRPDLVKQEASREENELRQLKSIFSDKHPRVIALEDKLAKLSQYLKPKDLDKEIDQEQFSSAQLDPGSRDLFHDLLKKYHYISVVMYMDALNHDSYLVELQQPFIPPKPIWPKRPLFFAWGVAIGLLSGALLALALESREQRRAPARRMKKNRVRTQPKARSRPRIQNPPLDRPQSPRKIKKKERVAQPLAVKSVPMIARIPDPPQAPARAPVPVSVPFSVPAPVPAPALAPSAASPPPVPTPKRLVVPPPYFPPRPPGLKRVSEAVEE